MVDAGPLRTAFEADSKGAISQKYTVYRQLKQGMIRVETTVRRYFSDGDYVDSTSSEILGTKKET